MSDHKPAQAITLTLNPKHWVTSNHRLHRMEEARRTAHIRHAAGWLARKHMTPMSGPVRVVATIHMPTRRRFDPPNAEPVLKAAVDGIVDAEILADDSAEHVHEWAFRPGPPTGETGVYRLTIEIEETT